LVTAVLVGLNLVNLVGLVAAGEIDFFGHKFWGKIFLCKMFGKMSRGDSFDIKNGWLAYFAKY
jgi:hypothetical protein